MVQVSSLYNKEFLKNPNFRIQVAYNGVNIHQNGMGPMQQSSLGLILPLHHVSVPYASTFLSKIKKSHHNSKSTCQTQFAHSEHSQKPICADFQAFLYTFSLYKLTFFHFLVLGSEANSQKFHILLILTGKNALKWLDWCMCLGFEVCQIQWHGFRVSMISASWKIKISGKNVALCWFWLAKMHQIGLSGVYLGFEECQNPMVQVSSLYNKEFLKNPNFRIQVAYNGVNIHQNGMGPMQQSSLGLILPLHHVSEPYASTFLSKIKKNHHNLKSTCQTKFTHSAHTQKPICADFQAFLYTFSLYKLTFFHFLMWESEANSHKFHILLILTVKNASNDLSGDLGFEAC